MKNIVGYLSESLNTLDKIRIFRYTLKEDPEKHLKIGVSAQDLMGIYPELVLDGYFSETINDIAYGVDYSTLSVIALQACKELHALVKIQREEINSLRSWRLDKEEQISSLESRIAKLEQMLNELTVK